MIILHFDLLTPLTTNVTTFFHVDILKFLTVTLFGCECGTAANESSCSLDACVLKVFVNSRHQLEQLALGNLE